MLVAAASLALPISFGACDGSSRTGRTITTLRTKAQALVSRAQRWPSISGLRMGRWRPPAPRPPVSVEYFGDTFAAADLGIRPPSGPGGSAPSLPRQSAHRRNAMSQGALAGREPPTPMQEHAARRGGWTQKVVRT
jgi:hypothetical protein